MESLQSILYNLIVNQGSATFNEVEAICKGRGNKVETGERKIRFYYQTELSQEKQKIIGYFEPIKDEKGHNKAFRHIPPLKEVKQEKLI